MEYIAKSPSYEEDSVYYNDNRALYINVLLECCDYVTLMSCRKPSLSEYDEAY